MGGVLGERTSHVVVQNAPSILPTRQSHAGDNTQYKGAHPSPPLISLSLSACACRFLSSGARGCKPRTCAGGSWNQPSAGSCTTALLARYVEIEREIQRERKDAPSSPKGSAVGAVATVHHVQRFAGARCSQRVCSRAPPKPKPKPTRTGWHSLRIASGRHSCWRLGAPLLLRRSRGGGKQISLSLIHI